MKNIDKLKYQIKYAVMPIKKEVGLIRGSNSLESKYKIVANIVSKCYVVGKKYLNEENCKIKYEVVFPYTKKNMSSFGDFKRVVPEYDSSFLFLCKSVV